MFLVSLPRHDIGDNDYYSYDDDSEDNYDDGKSLAPTQPGRVVYSLSHNQQLGEAVWTNDRIRKWAKLIQKKRA